MEGMEWKGSISRIRGCVFDLLSLEDEMIFDDDDSWELIGRDLSLKSTFLYCDLNHVISGAHDEHKRVLTDLANRLFYYMEQLSLAVKNRSVAMTQDSYKDTTLLLQDVMTALVPPH